MMLSIGMIVYLGLSYYFVYLYRRRCVHVEDFLFSFLNEEQETFAKGKGYVRDRLKIRDMSSRCFYRIITVRKYDKVGKG